MESHNQVGVDITVTGLLGYFNYLFNSIVITTIITPSNSQLFILIISCILYHLLSLLYHIYMLIVTLFLLFLLLIDFIVIVILFLFVYSSTIRLYLEHCSLGSFCEEHGAVATTSHLLPCLFCLPNCCCCCCRC